LAKPGSDPFPGNEWYLSANGDYLRGTIIGHGTVDFVQTMKILLRAGYDGYYSIEFDGIEPPEISIVNGLRNLRYYYEEAVRQVNLSEERALL
jgi:sugar phosphate isomerase/epimerase